MEHISGLGKGDDPMDLPPGFRFHPTDEELITHYLSKKVLDISFIARAIGEADLNKCEPWDLPRRAKMGENEWYFFCLRDRKYPTGLRTNRATEAGYWKATGKDKEIYREKKLVGMKKTLVFYIGRAPKGDNTNWVMHEYRLEGKYSIYNLPKSAKNEWVICRIFQKNSGVKEPYLSGLVRLSSFQGPSLLPPLMDSSPHNGKSKLVAADTAHVTCFSNSMEVEKNQENMIDCFNTPFLSASDISPTSLIFSKNSLTSSHGPPNLDNLQYPCSVLMQDQFILRTLLENHGSSMKQICKEEMEIFSILQETGLTSDMNNDISSVLSNHEMGRRAFDDQENPATSTGSVDLDSLWNY